MTFRGSGLSAMAENVILCRGLQPLVPPRAGFTSFVSPLSGMKGRKNREPGFPME